MKLGLCVLALSLAGSAIASYDLMLLPAADGRVYRYDPVSQVQLGSFFGYAGAMNIAADTSGRAIVGTNLGSAGKVYKYATGELEGTMTNQTLGRSLDLFNTNLLQVSATTATQYNSSTGALIRSVTLSNTVNWFTGAAFGNRYTAVGLTAANVITLQSFDLTSGILGALQSTGVAVTAGTILGKAAVGSNSFTNTNLLCFSYVPAAGGISAARIGVDAGGAIAVPTFTGFTLNTYSSAMIMPAALKGHGGVYFYGQDSANAANARIARYSIATSFIIDYSTAFTAFGGGFTNWSYQHPVNVVAPEPSGLVAIGLGMLLLRRRK